MLLPPLTFLCQVRRLLCCIGKGRIAPARFATLSYQQKVSFLKNLSYHHTRISSMPRYNTATRNSHNQILTRLSILVLPTPILPTPSTVQTLILKSSQHRHG